MSETGRVCSYCDLPIPDDDSAIRGVYRQSGDTAWAHVTCWYDQGPFERDMLKRDIMEALKK